MTVTLPLSVDEYMPDAEAVLGCEWQCPTRGPCTRAATSRVRIHVGCRDLHWELMLLCEPHLAELRDQMKHILATSPPWSCLMCGHSMRQLSDLVTVIPL